MVSVVSQNDARNWLTCLDRHWVAQRLMSVCRDPKYLHATPSFYSVCRPYCTEITNNISANRAKSSSNVQMDKIQPHRLTGKFLHKTSSHKNSNIESYFGSKSTNANDTNGNKRKWKRLKQGNVSMTGFKHGHSCFQPLKTLYVACNDLLVLAKIYHQMLSSKQLAALRNIWTRSESK